MRKFIDIIDFENNIEKALKTAVEFMIGEGRKGRINRIVIIAPDRRVCKDIERYVLSFRCRKNGAAFNMIGERLNIVLESKTTYNHFDSDGVIFFGLGSKEIFELEEGYPFVEEFAIKGYLDISLWCETWGVENFSTGQSILFTPNITIQHACNQITSACNITNTLCFHPSDEEFIKRVIRTLHSLEPTPVNRDEFFAYVKLEGKWTLALAMQASEWINKLNNGETLKDGVLTKTEMKELYGRW